MKPSLLKKFFKYILPCNVGVISPLYLFLFVKTEIIEYHKFLSNNTNFITENNTNFITESNTNFITESNTNFIPTEQS